jgi:hypothetical protein
MKTLAITAALLFGVTPAVQAAEEFDATAASRMLAPFVERDTIAVVHIDVARVNVKPLLALLGRIVPEQKIELSNAEGAANMMINLVRGAGVSDAYAVATLGGKSMFPKAFLVVPDSPQLNALALSGVLNLGGQGGGAGYQGRKVGDAYVLPLTTHLAPLPEKFNPADRPELREALAAAGKTAAQFVLIPPASSRRVVEELLPQLPNEIGGGPSTVFTHGISWAAASIDLSPALTSRLVIKSQDAQSAEALKTKWLDLLKLAGQQKDVRQALPEFEKLVAALTPKVSDDRLTLVLDEQEVEASGLLGTIRQAAGKARDSAGRAQTMNNLKQIALGMYNYHEKHFPPAAIRSADGKPLLSWRVAILPYLNEEQLYKQFHLNEPWDSPHNKALIEKMPALFRSPASKAAPGMTNYVVPVGNGALYSSIGDEPAFKDISDGTSNTIMIVAVDDKHSVVWTKPEDLAFDPQDPKKGIGSLFPGAFPAAMCDGSVRILRTTIDPTTLKALITRAGGEVVGEY